MKFKYKNAIQGLVFFFASFTLFTSCVNKDEFFELKDRGGIDAAIWDAEGSVQLHLNRTYDVAFPRFPFDGLNSNVMNGRYGIHMASDENYFPNSDQYARLALGMQGEMNNNDVRFAGNKYGGNFGENKYMDISRCNNAIKYIPRGKLPAALKRSFLGQYYMLRAMTYFGMVKVYGGVPLILEPQDPENVTLAGRASAKECFQAILNDLDSAIVNLDGITWDDGTGRGKLTKLAATCYKGKVLMYWASPQFNPTNDPKHPYDPQRWQAAFDATEKAYNLAIASGKKLMPNYADIFTTEVGNTEAIMVKTYSSILERRGHDGERRVRPSSAGGSPHAAYRPTTYLLDAYPMKDGNNINTPGAYAYDPLMFWQNRDPRFTATFAYNGSIWPLEGKTGRKVWSYNGAAGESNVQALYSKRFSISSLSQGAANYSNNIGGNGMDWIEMRLAEVMLDYAECANEVGNISVAKDMVRQIRFRAGIQEIGLNGAADNDYGLAAVGSDKAKMRDLILKERMIELAFEDKRNSDLRRTRRMHLLSGSMKTIEIVPVNSAAKTALETINPVTGQMFRETINIEDKAVYGQYFRIEINPPSNYAPYNVPEFHYFYTFNNDYVKYGTNIAPTIGWAGGTFDPLD